MSNQTTGNKPVLYIGKASMRKKPQDKYKVVDVTQRDIKKTLFVESFELYDLKWNRFKDSRGWEWVQEIKNEKV